MRKKTVLIAGCGTGVIQIVTEQLLRQGYAVVERPDKIGALQTWKTAQPDLLVIGASQDDAWDGMDLVQEIRQRDVRLPLILINSHSSEDRVIAALRAGVNDYFKPPYDCDELLTSIQRNLCDSPPSHSVKRESFPKVSDTCLFGDSAPTRGIKTYVGQLSASDTHVLITGETGTGKERVADLIHQCSARQAKPVVKINCAALPESLFESELFGYERGAFTGANASYEGKLKLADGGTVFFDEIGDMSPYVQAKILRVIETKETYRLGGKRNISLDFRVIAATNQDLELLVAENKFRKDRYFRLNVAHIHLPPLRERPADIPLLVNHFLTAYNAGLGRHVEGPCPEVWPYLLRYEWPGNVRELKNVLEAILITRYEGPITLMDLPPCLRRHHDSRESVTSLERELLLSALSAAKWNKSKAAQQLHWSRMTLYRKMAKYHIQ